MCLLADTAIRDGGRLIVSSSIYNCVGELFLVQVSRRDSLDSRVLFECRFASTLDKSTGGKKSMHALSLLNSKTLPNACLLYSRVILLIPYRSLHQICTSVGPFIRDFVPREYQFDLLCPLPFLCFSLLTLALKVRRGGEDSDALVHSPFADPQVVIDPFLQARCFCELFWLNTRTVPSPEGERVYVSATVYVLCGVV